MSPVPAVTGSEPPSRRREFRHLRAAHISKALAGAVGVSRSYTSRQLRGEDPVPGETFRTWCARAARDGFLSAARAEIAEDAAVVGLGVYALPTETGPAIAEVGDLVEAASSLAACVLRALADGELSVEEIDQARRVLPDLVFRELYLAEFLDEAAGVFAGWSDCVAGAITPPLPGRDYVIGADFGRKRDWSVFTVIDTVERHVVHQVRTQLPWPSQVQTLANLAETFNGAEVWADATGIGDPICQDLELAGAYVVPVVLSPRVKTDIIVRLQGVIERQEVTYPAELQVLQDELDVFGYEVLPSGGIRYTAPSGFHDDCVYSLALGVHGVDQGGEVVIHGAG